MTGLPRPSPSDRGSQAERRLDSWGEIAAYLHRSVSTVQRWEKLEGLPVRRIAHGKLGSVYATASDLDAWREERSRHPLAPPAEGGAARATLVVLPFQNLSGSTDQDFFSDGLTEELITHIARLEPDRLAVIARTSAMAYRNTGKDVRAIAAELGVAYVLEGSVRRGADRVRITAQLVAAADGMHLWADTYDQPLADVLEVHSAIAQRVGASLRIHLLPGLGPGARQSTPEARDEYLKGRYFRHLRSADGFRGALRCFRRAIELDAAFAAAHAGLADTYAVLGMWFYAALPPKEAFPRARAGAEEALRLDPGLAEAWMTLGFVQYEYEWDWKAAERSFQRALDLDPNLTMARQRYAALLGLQGRIPEALEVIERARRLDPLSLLVNHTVAWLHYFARDYDRALAQGEVTRELNPSFPMTHLLLGVIYTLSGRIREAAAEYDEVERLHGPTALGTVLRACHHARAGERDKAQRGLRELRRSAAAGEASPWHLAMVHASLGAADEAFAALERAYEERSDVIAFLKVEPHWDPIRDDLRFSRLLARVGLA